MFLLDQNEQIICTLDNEKRPLLEDLQLEELNGKHTYELTIPGDMDHAEDVTEGNFILFQDIDGLWQMYEVINIEEEHEDRHEKTAFCEHVSTELNDEIVRDKRPQNTTAELALISALEETRWQVGTVAALGENSTNFYEISAMEAIGKIIDTWGGEVRFRIELVGREITGRYVDILARRGAETGKRIEYKKDIESITREVDMSDVKTALLGRGRGEELETGGYGRRIRFDIDGKDYVEDDEARQRWGRVNPDGTRRHRFGIFEDAQEEDESRLQEKTEKALEKVKDPMISYEIDFADLEIFGLRHERVRLGDTVTIIDRAFKPELKIQARVIEERRSKSEKETGKIRLGNFLPNISSDNRLDKIESSLNRNQGIWERDQEFEGPVPTDWLDGVIDTLTNQLVASGEYDNAEVIEGTGFLLENTKVGSPGYGALYLGPGIFAIAEAIDPATDDWDWRSFGTGKGFTADVINAGILQGGKVRFNLEEGTLLIGDSTTDYDLMWDGSQLWIDGNIVVQNGEVRGSLQVGSSTGIRRAQSATSPVIYSGAQSHGTVDINESRFKVYLDGTLIAGSNGKNPQTSGELNDDFRGFYVPSQIHGSTAFDGVYALGGPESSVSARWKFNNGSYLRQDDDEFRVYFLGEGNNFAVLKNGDIRVKGDIIDYIVEEGSNNDGYWQKFSDGTMLVYGIVSVNFNTSDIQSFAFPQTFADDPALSISAAEESIIGGSGYNSRIDFFNAITPRGRTTGMHLRSNEPVGEFGSYDIAFKAIGRW